jgi:RNA polymerase sigma factor (sigma-70 family)
LALRDKNELVHDLATQHGFRLRRFLRSRVRNPADIPDLIQETFLRLLRVPNHETIRTPETYIFTVAHHVAMQHSISNAPSRRSVQLEDVLSEVPSMSEADPALEVSAQQCLEDLDKAFDELSPNVKSVFILCRRDGLSMDEISVRLGISLPMAKKNLLKALVHFRMRLKEQE